MRTTPGAVSAVYWADASNELDERDGSQDQGVWLFAVYRIS